MPSVILLSDLFYLYWCDKCYLCFRFVLLRVQTCWCTLHQWIVAGKEEKKGQLMGLIYIISSHMLDISMMSWPGQNGGVHNHGFATFKDFIFLLQTRPWTDFFFKLLWVCVCFCCCFWYYFYRNHGASLLMVSFSSLVFAVCVLSCVICLSRQG